ncbi:gliding motility-associated C-terminal domain-containing protein [Hymenobacter antarcticus]|uniref:Gliding motility-associated C-terminal domain-containing protein n=1 Tax=Hymenobacter antarcticus TaxID=486270 RepID=A0ABP7Q1E0_9BACT
MNLPFLSLLLLFTAGLGLRSPAARAQTLYQPVAVSGFTDDVVVDGRRPAAQSATNPVDQGVPNVRWCYTAPSYRTVFGAAPVSALPATGLISSVRTPGLRFQLASYEGRNSLRLAGTSTGALTLATPQPAAAVYVLAACGNGSSPVSITVTFADQTTQTFAAVVPDWYGGANYAIQGVSRVNFDTNAIENNLTDPRLYEVRLPLAPANAGKLVQRLTFAKSSAGPAPILNVMAISLELPCALPGGTLTASAGPVCPGQPVVLTALLVGGRSFSSQWQASTDNGMTWADIAGATQLTYTAAPLAGTQYRLRIACPTSSALLGPVAVAVTAAGPPATLAYSRGSVCQRDISGPTVVFGPGGGRFSAPPGLALDAATGRVAPAASAPGTYIITYTAPGLCPGKATATLTVLAPVVATVAYAAPAFCTAAAHPTPVAQPLGGTFSGGAGLALDPATGTIDLARTPAGTYPVTYSIAGNCGSTATTQVTITGNTPPVFPNVITPGPDRLNQSLTFRLTDVREYTLQVFSRWGRLVWQSHDPTQGWTADESSAGTYFYRVVYTDCANRPQAYRGWVEVIK